MSVITPPTLRLSSFTWRLQRSQIVSRSPFGSQAIEAATPLWTVSMTGVHQYPADALAFELFLENLDGLRNQVALWHQMRPYPAGTLRGALVLDADADAGAVAVAVDGGVGQAGATLLQGDLIGLGTGLTQQVVRVAADAVADGAGVMAVTLSQALRNDFAAGAAVAWDRPAALFRQIQDNSGIEYTAGRIGRPWALDLLEDPRP